jgi:hypothetical protein
MVIIMLCVALPIAAMIALLFLGDAEGRRAN